MFGFLDSTKELNTKGIGLGLHISKMIVEQFGGSIVCKSEWGHGSTFTFIIAMSELIGQEITVKRCLNPI